MAAAGPIGNLLIAVTALLMMKAGLGVGWLIAPEHVSFDSVIEFAASGPTLVTTALSVLLVMNVFLCAFNLLPLPPLDGSAVFGALLPEALAERVRGLQSNAMMSMIGLVVAWQVFPLATDPLFSFLLRIVHPGDLYY